MCAINGIVAPARRDLDVQHQAKELVELMNKATAHRGPDGSGVWEDEQATLGHNRLAIIDLSETANQPMVSATGSTVIVFNGEIYNFKELKEELSEYPFKTQSDTEVILAAYEAWGTDAFAKFRGMFAFALWDSARAEVLLVRDHSGIKPLFWRQDKGTILFSSELKGLLADKSFARRISHKALLSYLRLRYVPEPLSLIEGVNKLPPASFARVKEGKIHIETYANVPLSPLVTDSKHEALLQVEALVDKAVSQELVSDRPLGVFLSGGLDSSIVLDCAVRGGASGVSTYSLRFGVEEGEQADKFNADADLAKQTALQYETNHNEILFTEADFVALLKDAPKFFDEPVGNATAIAQMHLARRARKDIVVALMGEGGDELFGGYPRYRLSRIMDRYQILPTALRSLLSRMPSFFKLNTPQGIERVALFMFEKDDLLRRAVNHEFISDAPASDFKEKYLTNRDESDFTQLLMDADRRSWLPDEALARTDRMTMASALEARVPLLNFDLVSYTSRLGSQMRDQKKLLREAFSKRLPQHVLKGEKRGFFSPIAKWLRRPELKELSRQALAKGFHPPTDALLNFAELNKLFDEHIEGTTYCAPLIWTLVSLRLWAKEYDAHL